MVQVRFAVISIALAATAIGCTEPQPTPSQVVEEFETLIEAADERIGASVARLTEFKARNREFDIGPAVEQEIDRLRSLADGQYHEARELAREGEFGLAEEILTDLATHLSDTRDGRSARDHLEFDFHMGRAQWLIVRQQWAESGELARMLLERDLTSKQRDQAESILDNAGFVGTARSQAERAQAQSSTRHLTIYLETMYMEEGSYPSKLTLADVEAWDPVGTRSILRALSAIEDYEQTEISYAFTAVSESGKHRLRVVDGVIER